MHIEPEELMAYLDGELPMDQAGAAATHLERCRDCQGLAADFQRVSRRLMEWQVEESNVTAVWEPERNFIICQAKVGWTLEAIGLGHGVGISVSAVLPRIAFLQQGRAVTSGPILQRACRPQEVEPQDRHGCRDHEKSPDRSNGAAHTEHQRV
jgi:Putative zinc-finger